MTGSTARRIGLALGGVFGAAVVLFAATVFVFGEVPVPRSTTSVCTQPDDVRYEDAASFSVFVKEPSFSLSLATPVPEAVVSRTGDGDHGVFVALHRSAAAGDVTCRWQPDRVEIVEAHGIVHVVPADVFTGGR